MITVIPHRVPSPREIVMHTQSIMQSALIKKKLEEQRENFRKRQDQQVQQRPSSPVNSPAKQTMSPTPLAFTPTSVLRKMTADKEPDGANQFHQVETAFSIPPINTQTMNYSNISQFQNYYQIHAFTSADLPKLSNSVNKVQNETLKMIFLRSAIVNRMNNNRIFELEESALKSKHLSSLQKKQNTENSSINTGKEDVVLDLNANTNDNAVKCNTVNADNDNDTNNNSPVSLDEVLKKSPEIKMLADENNKITTSAISEKTKNLDLQNATLLVIHDKNV